MADLYSGARSLGQALAGGGAAELRGQMAALQEQGTRASVDKKVQEAVIAREKRKAVENMPAAVGNFLTEHGVADNSSSSLFQSLIGMDQGADIQRVIQNSVRMGGKTPISAALEGEGFTPANAALATLDEKPIPSIDIDGDHVVMNKYGAEPVLDLTRLGEAKVQAEHALGDQREASADASHARAAHTRATPVSSALSGGHGGGKASTALGDETGTGANPTPADIEDLFLNTTVNKGHFIRKYGAGAFNNAMQFRATWMAQHKQAAKEGKGMHPAAPRDPAQRRAGTRYSTPKGDLTWTGTGWTH